MGPGGRLIPAGWGAGAVARSAHREAVAAFDQALRALQHLPESRDTLAQAIDLRLELRTALYPPGRTRRVLVCLQDAAALPRSWATNTGSGGFCYLLGHFVLACEPDCALAAGKRTLAIAAALGDIGSQSRRSTTWELSTTTWSLSSGARVCATERGMVSTARCSMSASAYTVWPPWHLVLSSSSPSPSAAPSPRGEHRS